MIPELHEKFQQIIDTLLNRAATACDVISGLSSSLHGSRIQLSLLTDELTNATNVTDIKHVFNTSKKVTVNHL